MLITGEYNDHKAIRQSHLKQILKSPAHYKLAMEKQESASKHFVLGSALHCCILEPNEFANRYVMIDGNRNSIAVRDAIFDAQLKGLTVLKSEEKDVVMKMANALHSHEVAAKLISTGLVEQGLSWEIDGIEYKCKPDLIRSDGIFIDLKTTNDASPRAFARSFFDYGYDFQCTFYKEGLEHNQFIDMFPTIIAIENVEPYNVMVYNIPLTALAIGMQKVAKARSVLRECLDTNMWPGYSNGVVMLDVPHWILKEYAYE